MNEREIFTEWLNNEVIEALGAVSYITSIRLTDEEIYKAYNQFNNAMTLNDDWREPNIKKQDYDALLRRFD